MRGGGVVFHDTVAAEVVESVDDVHWFTRCAENKDSVEKKYAQKITKNFH